MNTHFHGMARQAFLLALVFTTPAVLAQDLGDFPFDRFSIAAGSFFQTTEAELRVDAGTAALGTLIDFEKDLGVDASDQLWRFDVEWRPSRRNQLSAGYFELSRDGSRSLDREIHFGDTVFPVSASLEAQMDLQYAEIAYTFWAVRKEKGGLGLSLGAAALSFDTELAAQVTLPGGTGTIRREESASTDLPVPFLGLEARYALGSRFLVAANVGALPEVQIEDYEGSALTYGVSLEYRLFRHWGLGAAWNSFNIDADVEKERFRGSLDYTIEGAQAFLRIAL